MVQTGKWAGTGALAQPRSAAAAVLLPDGRVLITGGDVNGVPSSSVEIFNADGSIRSGSPMATARSGHSAFLLTSGEVLVTGGRTSGGGITNSAEIYDPTSNTWTAAASMQNARAGHTVIQLPDWTVLVVGGSDPSGAVSAVERYTPDPDTFTHAGVLNQARVDAAAAVLDDGRVLVAGGSIAGVAQNTTEIFNPATGASVAGPALNSARVGATATALFDGRIAVIGGNNGANDLASADVYDPAAGTWTLVAGGTPRSRQFAIALPFNNSILLSGGTAGTATDLFVPWANGNQGAFVATAASTASHNSGFGAPLATEGLLLAGGGDGGAGAELYRFATVRTDADDYQPGQTVIISGTGWNPGEQVTINLIESPNIDTHAPIVVTADGGGNILDSSFTTDQHDFQVRFFVLAHGAAADAATSFTDGGGAIAVAGVTSTTQTIFSYTGYTDSACTTVAGGQGQNFPKTITVTGNAGANLGLGNANFFRVTIPADPAGFKFNDWSNAASGTNRTTQCLTSGSGNNTTTAQANFLVANVSTSLSLTVSPGTVSFGSAGPVALQATLKDASNNPVAGASITFAVNGTNLSPAATTNASGVASFSYNPSALPASATAYSVGSTFSAATISGLSFLGSSATGSLTVNKATPVITWANPADIAFGTALSTTQLNATATANGAAVPGAFTYTPAAGTVLNAGTNQTLSVDFVPNDSTNYNSVLHTTALINVLKATPAISVSGGPFTFDGTGHAASITVTGVGGAAVSGSTAITYNGNSVAPIDAGTYSVSVSFTSADPNYSNTTGSGSIVIDKADSITTVSGTFSFTYDATPHPANVSVTGAGGLSLTPDPAYNCGHAPINVADSGCTASFSFAGDNNHNPSSDSKTYTVSKATPLVSVSGGPFTFDGNSHSATIVVAGVGGVSVTGTLAVTYNGVAALPLNAGTYAVGVSFTSSDNNYTDAMGSGSIVINKAPSVTTVSGTFTFTYDATAHPATVSVTGAGGLSLTPDPVYSCGHAPINVSDSGCTASYNFSGDENHNPSSDSRMFTITKATPLVSVSGGPFTFDGNSHPATIVVTGVGGGSVAGTSAVTYNGVATLPVNAGTYAVGVTFTSSDNNYDNASGSGSILINKAASVTTVSGVFTFVYDATAHPAAVSVTGAGGLNLTPDPVYSCGHAPINVADSGCTASYSFPGDDNHNPSSDSRTYSISRATPLVSVTGGTFIFDGNTHPAGVAVTGVGGVNVSGTLVLTYNGLAALPLNANSYVVSASFTSSDNNYDNATGAGSVVITQAPSATTVSGVFSFTYDGNPHPATVSVTGAGGLNLAPSPLYSCGHVPTAVADSGCIASYNYPGDINHAASSDAKTYTIGKATPVLTINPVATLTIGNPVTISGTLKLGALIPTGSVTITLNGASQTAAVGAGGTFSTIFPAGTVDVGSFGVSGIYPGDTNFFGASNSGLVTFAVQYGVCYLYDQTKAVQHNATVPIKLQLCDSAGHNLSSSAVTVTATSVALLTGATGTLEDSGNANPDDNFRYDPTLQGYIFNLSTKSLNSGTWRLYFRTSKDAGTGSPYMAGFGVR
jgi:hypothetical protein